MINTQKVLDNIKEQLCHEGTTYKGKSGTYKYIVGRTTTDGTINGVVHKIDEEGNGKTAGSFKILADGTVTRFTGIATKTTLAITKSVQSEQSEVAVEESQDETQEAIAV